MSAVSEFPIAMIVVRAMLGFTPPEWAYVAAQKTGLELSQGFIPKSGPQHPHAKVPPVAGR